MHNNSQPLYLKPLSVQFRFGVLQGLNETLRIRSFSDYCQLRGSAIKVWSGWVRSICECGLPPGQECSPPRDFNTCGYFNILLKGSSVFK